MFSKITLVEVDGEKGDGGEGQEWRQGDQCYAIARV